jgi:hypothetical protein
VPFSSFRPANYRANGAIRHRVCLIHRSWLRMSRGFFCASLVCSPKLHFRQDGSLLAIHAASSESSQPQQPGEMRRRCGNMPLRSRGHRVVLLRPDRRRHSGSRTIRSGLSTGGHLALSPSGAIAEPAWRARGFEVRAVLSISVSPCRMVDRISGFTVSRSHGEDLVRTGQISSIPDAYFRCCRLPLRYRRTS